MAEFDHGHNPTVGQHRNIVFLLLYEKPDRCLRYEHYFTIQSIACTWALDPAVQKQCSESW